MTIANALLHAPRSFVQSHLNQPFPNLIHNLLESRNGDTNVVLVRFPLFRHGLGDALSQTPQLDELVPRLGQNTRLNEWLIAAHEALEEVVEFLRAGWWSIRYEGILDCGNKYLFVVFLPSATRLYEDKCLGTLDLARIHALALSVLDREVVCIAIKVFECGENLGEVTFGRFKHWEDVFERGKGEQEVIG